MDPEARVVVTAKDATATAFASADKNLKQFQRSLTGIRQIAASFGVVFSARAFLGWIDGALKAADATGEHAEAVKAAQETLKSMKSASDALALSIGTSLVPAMEALTAVFTGWNRLISGADPFPFEAAINATANQLHAMEVQLQASQGMPREWRENFSREIDAVRDKLADLRLAQERALGLGVGGAGIRKPTLGITDEEVQMINNLIAEINTPAARQPLITQEELVQLETFIYELNERPPFITQEELIDLETFIAELNTAQEMLTQEEWIDLESFIYDLNQMESEAAITARSIGLDFRHSFSGWLKGANLGFKELLRQMAIDMAVSGIFDAFASMFSKNTSGLGKFMTNFFGGSRANEGPVSAGMIYKVHPGEAFFAPGMDGKVEHLAGAGGPPMVINQYNTFSGGDQREQAAAIAANNARLKQEIKSEILYRQRRGQWG